MDAKVHMGILLPGAKPLDPEQSGLNTTKKGIVRCGSNGSYIDHPAYVKLIEVDRIAKEVLAAVLLNLLKIPCPEPMIVLADGSLAYGCLDLPYPSFSRLTPFQTHIAAKKLPKWEHLVQSASFDEWIANNDRHAGNILFDGEGFFLIDHELCIPDHYTANKPNDMNELRDVAVFQKTDSQRVFLRNELIRKSKGFHLNAQAAKNYFDSNHYPNKISQQINNLLEFVMDRLDHIDDILFSSVKVNQSDLFNGNSN